MDPSEEKKEIAVSAKRQSYLLPAGLLCLLIIMGGGVYYFLRSGSISSQTDTASPEVSAPSTSITEELIPPTPPSAQKAEDTSTTKISKTTERTEPVFPDREEVSHGKKDTTELPVPTLQSSQSRERKELAVFSECSQASNDIASFYKNLDTRDYIKAQHIPPPSDKYFKNLIQKLLTNPPEVTGETDDLYTILKNTAHFFRIAGKDNILLMKGVLNRERQSLEKILADYYFLITCPSCSNNPSVSYIDRNGLYDYACFFLNTMGGRLYLFRRDSLSRMVVTYYAILLIDQANEQNNNRHGISLTPAVNMLISEMETSGSALQKSDLYLDTLYNLKEKYQ